MIVNCDVRQKKRGCIWDASPGNCLFILLYLERQQVEVGHAEGVAAEDYPVSVGEESVAVDVRRVEPVLIEAVVVGAVERVPGDADGVAGGVALRIHGIGNVCADLLEMMLFQFPVA